MEHKDLAKLLTAYAQDENTKFCSKKYNEWVSSRELTDFETFFRYKHAFDDWKVYEQPVVVTKYFQLGLFDEHTNYYEVVDLDLQKWDMKITYVDDIPIEVVFPT